MLIRVWVVNKRGNETLFCYPATLEEAGKHAKSLLAAGYAKVWIEVEEV